MFFFVNRLPRFAIRCANANDSVRILSQKTRRPNRNLALSYFCRARTAAKTMDATDGWPKMIRLGNRKSHFGDKTNRRRIAHLKTQCCHHRKKYFLFQKHMNQRGLFLPRFADGRCCCKVKAMKQRHQAAQIKIMDYLLKILTIKHFLMQIYS